MKKFVRFFAKGVIYARDKRGKPNGIDKVMRGNGVTLESRDMPGKIFMQCPDLFPCDYVEVETSPIM